MERPLKGRNGPTVGFSFPKGGAAVSSGTHRPGSIRTVPVRSFDSEIIYTFKKAILRQSLKKTLSQFTQLAISAMPGKTSWLIFSKGLSRSQLTMTLLCRIREASAFPGDGRTNQQVYNLPRTYSFVFNFLVFRFAFGVSKLITVGVSLSPAMSKDIRELRSAFADERKQFIFETGTSESHLRAQYAERTYH